MNKEKKLNSVCDRFKHLQRQLEDLQFFSKYWESQRLHLKKVYTEKHCDEVFSINEFDELLMSGALMSPHLDIVENGNKNKPQFTNSPSPNTDVTYVLQKYQSGATIRVPHIEIFMPNLQKYCKLLEQYFGIPIRANLYMTPPFSQGFQPHYDLDDILVLQLYGHKIWSYHEHYSNQKTLPNRDMNFNSALHQPKGIPVELLMQTGDVLYLPRGFMHEARTEDKHSIHVTFAFIGNNVGEMMQQMIRTKSIQDVSMRKLIRAIQHVDNKDRVELKNSFTKSFLQMDDNELLQSSLSFHNKSFDQHRNPDFQGQLASLIIKDNSTK